VELDFLSEVPLGQIDLNCAGLVGIQLAKNLLNLIILKVDVWWVRADEKEILDKALTGAETSGGHLVLLFGWLLQECDVDTILSDEVGKLLNRCFRPSLNTLQELALMTIIEILN